MSLDRNFGIAFLLFVGFGQLGRQSDSLRGGDVFIADDTLRVRRKKPKYSFV